MYKNLHFEYIKGKKNSSGSFQTGADILEDLADEYEIAEKILQWRGLAKLKSTYTNALQTEVQE